MIRLGYCAGSVSEIDSWPTELAQITLNSRVSLDKRDYPSLLRKCETKVLLHYDYIHTITRYAIFSKWVRWQMLREITEILEDDNANLVGLVIHTDFPIRKGVYLGTETIESYKKKLFDFSAVESHTGDRVSELSEISINSLYRDLEGVSKSPKRLIYLENTTKVFQGEMQGVVPGSWDWIKSQFKVHPEYTKYFGACLDTEHYYAVEGKYPDIEKEIKECRELGCDIVVHLNTVPKEVKDSVAAGKLYKDVHSETLLSDCSLNSSEYYLNDCARILKDVIAVREIKSSYMEKELDILRNCETGWK